MTGHITIRINKTDTKREENYAFIFTSYISLFGLLIKWAKKADTIFIYPKK